MTISRALSYALALAFSATTIAQSFDYSRPNKIVDGVAVYLTDAEWQAFQKEQSTAVSPPDGSGFITDLKTAMGGVVAANTLAKAYPLFYPAVQNGQWPDVQALIIDAHTTGVLSDAQYAAFKQLAAAHSIPVTLP